MPNSFPSPEFSKRNNFKSPQEELSELMKEANEKLFNSGNKNGYGGGLPLSVEIEEMNPGEASDSVSPPSGRPNFFANSLMQNSTPDLLSPRKRGRKPKHYSEILYELGQR